MTADNDAVIHGTTKQHLRYLRLRQAGLSQPTTTAPAPAVPILETKSFDAAAEQVQQPKPKPAKPAKEYKLVTMREVYVPESPICDNPDASVRYWHRCIATNPYYTGDAETLAVLILTTRRRVRGFHIVSNGTLDTILVCPREVFRLAIVDNAAAIIIMHNHPSGDPTPSEADIKITRDLIRAGQLLKIELLDHVVIGTATPERPKAYSSLKELGYFYS